MKSLIESDNWILPIEKKCVDYLVGFYKNVLKKYWDKDKNTQVESHSLSNEPK